MDDSSVQGRRCVNAARCHPRLGRRDWHGPSESRRDHDTRRNHGGPGALTGAAPWGPTTAWAAYTIALRPAVGSGTWIVICGGAGNTSALTLTAPANYTTNFLAAEGLDTSGALVGSGYRSPPPDEEDDPVFHARSLFTTGGTTGPLSWIELQLKGGDE